MEQGEKQRLLSGLPSVDELLKNDRGLQWLSRFPRRIVVQAVREVIASKRDKVLKGYESSIDFEEISEEICEKIDELSSFSLRRVVNATGIVIHTNLGRSVLSGKILGNVAHVGGAYSNLEYDLKAGRRGKRHTHTGRLLREITGAEDALIVNNNAAAVLLALSTLARGREVVVSRGELVEIGGSFRVPDVMAASGAVLREVGTTNKTHPRDYSQAIGGDTALILKVHQSNYKIIGFTEDVKIEELASIGKKHGIPVMYDLGSGCLLDLRPYGILGEPTVQEVLKSGVDVVSFSGDKLLGGPQGGIIVGKKEYLEKIRKNPLARAVRVDKFTIAAFEATLMEYMDPETARSQIPTLRMLLQPVEEIRARAGKIAARLRREIKNQKITVVQDMSKAGGGSLPEAEFQTFAVSISPSAMSVNKLEALLRASDPPVIARIRGDALLLDARTVDDREIPDLVNAAAACLSGRTRCRR